MASSLSNINTRPKTQHPITTKAVKGQVRDNSGGFVFKVDDLMRVRRFLILGAEDTFYETGRDLAKQSFKTVEKFAKSDRSNELVDLIVEISTEGRAAKQDPGLFALAVASSYGSTDSKRYALSKLPAVARTSSSLFTFVGFATNLRGWGPTLKRAVGDWILTKDADKLAYQVVKYGSRKVGDKTFTQKRLFDLTRVYTTDPALLAVRNWVVKDEVSKDLPKIIKGFIKIRKETEPAKILDIVVKYGLPWEAIPSEKLTSKVWETLIDNGQVPLTALTRNLGQLTSKGVIKTFDERTGKVAAVIRDVEQLKRARIHPLNVLVGLKTYAAGHGVRGTLSWSPVKEITDALDDSFYKAFDNVEPAGKRTLIALDVSPSMFGAAAGATNLTAMEASAALAMVTEATEPMTHITAFSSGSRSFVGAGRTTWGRSTGIVEVQGLTAKTRLDGVLQSIRHEFGHSWGGTDCALPMLYALDRKIPVDTFIIYTDNDTNTGSIHPFEALKEYRKKMGINAKLIVVAMTPSKFSIADPSDGGMLDVVGFDTAVPALIANFSAGRL